MCSVLNMCYALRFHSPLFFETLKICVSVTGTRSISRSCYAFIFVNFIVRIDLKLFEHFLLLRHTRSFINGGQHLSSFFFLSSSRFLERYDRLWTYFVLDLRHVLFDPSAIHDKLQDPAAKSRNKQLCQLNAFYKGRNVN